MASRTTEGRRPLTARGEGTRRRLLAAGERVFGRRGFHDASIAEITSRAGVALGTFYLYFESKHELFTALIAERGREMRATMAVAEREAVGRAAKERAGFDAFLRWIAGHRDLYRVVRQAEYVDHDSFERWYRSIADGYASGLRAAMRAGEVDAMPDPETLAYCLMGIGDFVGMRWLLWEPRRSAVPESAFETLAAFVSRGLGPLSAGDGDGAAADGSKPRAASRRVTAPARPRTSRPARPA